MKEKKYRFELIKGSKKTYCPACNKKRFVPYVYAGTNREVGPQYGRCDREQSCGYHLYPRGVNNPDTATFAPIDRRPVIQLPKYRFNIDILAPFPWRFNPMAAYYVGNGLVASNDLDHAADLYNVGTSGQTSRWVIFPQIDEKKQVRTAKAIAYNSDGHRDHGSHPQWLHKRARESGELEQCFFGLHLLAGLPDKSRVYIVESEKTALIMSAVFGWTWLATGGAGNLANMAAGAMKELKRHEVVIIPDVGQFARWRGVYPSNKAAWIDIDLLFNCNDGDDILDVLEREHAGAVLRALEEKGGAQ